MRKKWVLPSLIALWGVLVGSGTVALVRYAGTPGDDGTPVPSWPTHSALTRSPDAFTLVMFLHPLCPCSQASVSELARLTAAIGHHIQTVVVFTRPAGLEELIRDESLWKRVVALDGVAVMEDPLGEEAARFGAKTSGHALLFDPTGRRVFTGGITPSRGHEGSNMGSAAIKALVKQSPVASHSHHTAVFGCSLFGKAISRLVFRWTET